MKVETRRIAGEHDYRCTKCGTWNTLGRCMEAQRDVETKLTCQCGARYSVLYGHVVEAKVNG